MASCTLTSATNHLDPKSSIRTYKFNFEVILSPEFFQDLHSASMSGLNIKDEMALVLGTELLDYIQASKYKILNEQTVRQDLTKAAGSV